MELHFWLIPILAIVVVSVAAFYLIILRSGGSGKRTEGRTLFDEPEKKEEKEETKVGWNYYSKH